MKITRIITVAALALFSLEALDATAEALPVVAEASVLQIRLPPPPPRPPAPPNPFRRRHRRPVVRRHRRIHIKLPPRPPAPPNPLHLPTPPHP